MRIFLIRHGESLGNVDPSVYKKLDDHNVPLTEWGYEQAVEAEKFIRQYLESQEEIKDVKLRVWHSPFKRTKQTKNGFVQGLGPHCETVREDYLLREQDFGLFSDIHDEEEQRKLYPVEFEKWDRMRNQTHGKVYARAPGGESRADVAQRVRIFEGTMMRDKDHGIDNVAIIAHGVTNRAFEMDFLHKGIGWLENEPNPGNCDIVLIEGDGKKGYTAKKIYEGKLRPSSMPADYKATAYGAGRQKKH